MIEPTVGRVVLYYPHANEADGRDFAYPDKGQPCVALVAKVHGNDCLNLAVFDADGQHHARQIVELIQDEPTKKQVKNGGYCVWMPYQKWQAKRTEEAERKVSDAGQVGGSTPLPQQ